MSRLTDALDSLLSKETEGSHRGAGETLMDARYLSRVEEALKDATGQSVRRRGEPLTDEQTQLSKAVKKELEARGVFDSLSHRGYKPITPQLSARQEKSKK